MGVTVRRSVSAGTLELLAWVGAAYRSIYVSGGGAPMYVNAGNYATVADAIAATPAGGMLYFPAGTYTVPDAAGWTISKAMTILGAGEANIYGDAGIGTIFRPFNAHQDSTVFTVTGDEVIFKNLMIGNASVPGSTGTGDGIRVGSASRAPAGLRLENVSVINMGRHGLHLMGDADWTAAIGSEAGSVTYYGLDRGVVNGCHFSGNRGCGVRGAWVTSLSLMTVWCIGNRLEGLRIKYGTGVSLQSFATQDNGDDMASANWRGQAELSSCRGCSIGGSYFEDFEQNTNKNALILENCNGVSLNGLDFLNTTEQASTLAITLIGETHGVMLTGWSVLNVGTALSVLAGGKNSGNFLMAPSVRANSATCPATVEIPAETSSVASSSGGNFALLPRTGQAGGSDGMSYFGAIQFPMVDGAAEYTGTLKQGLLIWDSSATGTAKLKYYDGSAWRTVTAV